MESGDGSVLQKRTDRREALSLLLGGLATGAAAASACSPLNAATPVVGSPRLEKTRI